MLRCAQEHCCFVDVAGSIVTEPGQLAAAASKAAEAASSTQHNSSATLLEADHVYNPSSQGAPGAVVAVLHAAAGSQCWQGWHTALKAAVASAPASAPLVYAHRPVLAAACQVGACRAGQQSA
jgi:hypothetical protein